MLASLKKTAPYYLAIIKATNNKMFVR